MYAKMIRKYSKFTRNTALAFPLIFAPLEVAANDFTARKVMKEMNARERYSYIAGVIEGLSVARYMKDGKQKAGMECINDWFYEDKTTIDAVYLSFGKYPDYPPGAIIDVLAKQKCGE